MTSILKQLFDQNYLKTLIETLSSSYLRSQNDIQVNARILCDIFFKMKNISEIAKEKYGKEIGFGTLDLENFENVNHFA